MTLEKRIYIGAKYEHSNVQGKIEITTGKDNTPIKIDFRKVSSITEEVMYWRKANHIHKWFVEIVKMEKMIVAMLMYPPKIFKTY